MIGTSFVIIRDEYLEESQDSYPVASYDDLEPATKAMHTEMQKIIDECSDGEHECIKDFRVSSTKHWFSLNAENSGYYIALRMCAVPHNALSFNEEND